MIRYSCHSENFGAGSMEDAFSFISALGYDCMDFSCRQLLSQEKIISDPRGCASQVAELSQKYGLPVSELFLSLIHIDGKSIPAASHLAHTRDFDRTFDTICCFAEHAGFTSIMGGTGSVTPELDFQETFENTACTLQNQVTIAASHGLRFHVEPYRLSLLKDVDICLEMVRAVPDLRYTLDFLHFQIQGIPQSESMKLIPLAGHMHIRQAQTGIGKCNFADGEIDYARIVKELKRTDWSGDIATEFWCTPEMTARGIQAVEQNIVMRYYMKMLFERNSENTCTAAHTV